MTYFSKAERFVCEIMCISLFDKRNKVLVTGLYLRKLTIVLYLRSCCIKLIAIIGCTIITTTNFKREII